MKTLLLFLLACPLYALDRNVPAEFVQHCAKVGAEMIPVADTGSMEPLINGKTVLAVKPVPYTSLKRGDVVVFERAGGKLIVHRLHEKYLDEWITRGDNLSRPDELTMTTRNFRGKVVTFVQCPD